MDKDAIYALAGVGSVCWVIGGAGPKWVRRWLWPIVAAAVAIGFGAGYWQATSLALLMAASCHLGYSPERKSVAWIVATGSSFGLALAPLLWPDIRGILRAMALMVMVFCGGMSLSLKWNRLSWKIVEAAAGFAQGALIASSLLHL